MSSPLSSKDVEWVRRFCDYFRARAQNAVTLAKLPPSAETMRGFHPEQHVLVAAGLDALAGYWAKTVDVHASNGAQRMAAVLETHGTTDTWSRCCAFDLYERAKTDGRDDWHRALTKILRFPDGSGLVRGWRSDPNVATLAANDELVSLGIPPSWLSRSRYGEILYRDYRCMWIHEFTGSERVQSFDDDSVAEPQYMNVLDNAKPKDPVTGMYAIIHRLHMPFRFLVDEYARVIDGFERYCLSNGVVPPRS